MSIKTFVVLGMHRSATSLVAKSLSKTVHMGKNLLPATKDNKYGHFENREFYRLNKKILLAAGGSWDMPPSKQAILDQRQYFDDEIKALVKKSERPLWGWKDPRTVLTIDLFAQHLTNAHYVCVFRNPDEVAKSLKARNNMTIKQGLDLANIYNYRIIEFMSKGDQW